MGAPSAAKKTTKRAAPRKNGAALHSVPTVAELTARVDAMARQVDTLVQLVAKLLAAQAAPQMQEQLASRFKAALSQHLDE